MNDAEGLAMSEREPSNSKFLSWPPPGLEAMQGRLWPSISLIAIGDIILVLPLLWSAAVYHEVWSFGPFGSSWWIPFVTTAIGLLVLQWGLARLGGLLRRAARIGSQGHGWFMMALVAADFSKDSGFLLQGARLFSEIPPAKRSLMLVTRVVGAAAYVGAGLWVPFGFVLSIMLGARGVVGPPGVWFLTVAPAALLLLMGLLSRLLGRKLSWEVRRDRYLRAAVDQQIQSLVADWNEQSKTVRQDLSIAGALDGHARSFKVAAVCVLLLAFLVFVPVVTVTSTGAVGTALAAIAVPNFNHLQSRMVAAEMMRRLALEPDGSVMSEAAGDALNSLFLATVPPSDRSPLTREPARVYTQEWFPEELDSVVATSRREWVMGLFERVRTGLSLTELNYLESIAGHPAHSEFRIVALADSIDMVGTRFALPYPDTITPFELPLPRFAGIVDGTDAHIALAAYELSLGESDRAETTLREVVSVGFRLIDDSPTIIDALIGARLVESGAEALEHYYEAIGRSGEAESLAWVRAGTEEALERAAATQTTSNTSEALRMMPDAVLNDTVVRGLRWEFFLTFATLAPCVNLNKVVFGPGQGYEQWLADAEQALVRWPSDELMFGFFQRGWFRGAGAVDAPAWVRAALRLTFGGSLGGTCAAQVGGVDMVTTLQ